MINVMAMHELPLYLALWNLPKAIQFDVLLREYGGSTFAQNDI